jgi:heat shock protein HslJ
MISRQRRHRCVIATTASIAAMLLSAVIVTAHGSVAAAQTRSDPSSALAGTAWRLVSIETGAGRPLLPSDDTAYTIDFQADGRLRARIDCNGGRARWNTPAPGRIEFGPLGLTQKPCKPGSLQDRIMQDWRAIRSWTLKANHLFLSVNGGKATYEFRPLPPKEPVTPAVASVGPIGYDCAQSGKPAGGLSATFYQTQPAMVLVERDGRARPAFAVPAASGTQYEAKDLMFREARGEATVTWSGTTLACRRR